MSTASERSQISQNRKRREISNPEADVQLIAPLANRELFKSRFAKARKMNDSAHRPPSRAAGWWSECSTLLYPFSLHSRE